MPSASDHYELLGLPEKRNGQAISQDELRQAYKRALLVHHPDKSAHESRPSRRSCVTVDDLAEAYKVLGNVSLRSRYDQELSRRAHGENPGAHTRHTGIETVDLEELEADETSSVWRRACRCGSEPAYVVTETELEENVEYGELITGCKGCSLWLKVMFTVEG